AGRALPGCATTTAAFRPDLRAGREPVISPEEHREAENLRPATPGLHHRSQHTTAIDPAAGRSRTVIRESARLRRQVGGPIPPGALLRSSDNTSSTTGPQSQTTTTKGGAYVVPEAARHAPRAAVAAAAGADEELGGRPRLGGRHVDAAAPLPHPRLRGGFLL